MGYLFTSESVSEGHPDKVADQISDAILDELLAYDPTSKVACETLVTTGQVMIAGEVTSDAYVDLQEVARRTIKKIGYTKSDYHFDGDSCGVLSAIHEQSADIHRGVVRNNPLDQGAGDQGMMFGYATTETEDYMPLPLWLAHRIVRTLAEIRHEGREMTYLRPDAKSQVTIEYADDGTPIRIDTIVVSNLLCTHQQHHQAHHLFATLPAPHDEAGGSGLGLHPSPLHGEEFLDWLRLGAACPRHDGSRRLFPDKVRATRHGAGGHQVHSHRGSRGHGVRHPHHHDLCTHLHQPLPPHEGRRPVLHLRS